MATSAPLIPALAFSFFDTTLVKDIHDLANSPEFFRNATEIAVIVDASKGLLVADIHGSIHLLNRQFVSTTSWVAHVGGRVTHMLERRGILVTLGEDDSARYPILKVWNLEKTDKKSGAPYLLRSSEVRSGNRPHPVSTVALSSSLSHLAIGFGDGTVLLYRHLDQSIFSGSAALTALPKTRTIHESPMEPITGLGFKEPHKENSSLYIFVVTLNGVWCYQVSGKQSSSTSTAVDEVGCGLGCAAMDESAHNMIVVRDEAVHLCDVTGRAASYSLEGHKSSVHVHLNYLVITAPPSGSSIPSSQPISRDLIARSSSGTDSDAVKVTVFDLENKLIAYSGMFNDGVRRIFSGWDNIYVLGNNSKLSCLVEKSTSAKLDMLYQKGLYSLALNLAKTQRIDESSIADIHRQFGDYLYSKGDYDGAMQQFVQTIGQLQPSYVVRKFLDAQRIHNLVTYLQELHSVGLANSDHTTLLLNTYTKLKDVARLDSFIKTESKRSSINDEKGELPFDLDTVIRVCRQAGYFEHASYLARKYERHEDYLRIQIEDAKNYKDALAYLRQLGPEAAETSLARYGRAMLDNLPEETTQLLIDICTSSKQVSPIETEEILSNSKSSGPSYLSYLALNRPTAVTATASNDTMVPPFTSVRTVKPVEAGSRQASLKGVSRSSTPPPISSADEKPAHSRSAAAVVKKPSPQLYFAHFVDHMDQFVVFLETVAQRRWSQAIDGQSVAGPVAGDEDEQSEKRDQIAVWNTLLELYLTLPPLASGASLQTKILPLLRSEKLPYDAMHALILCSSHSFTPGMVLLWEKLNMFEDVVRFWISKHQEGDTAGASQEVVKALHLYGPSNPKLYSLVLRFLTSTPELLSRHQADVEEVLQHIEDEKIMPPLAVIQVLSRNGVASVGLVKKWLMSRIKDARDEIQTDQQLIDSYRLETKTKQRQVQELTDPEHPRVFHVTRCANCSGQLDLPSVHFMCNHSFHQRCLAENDTECPVCGRQHGVIQEIRRNNERLAEQHDLFLSEVKENGFRAVAGGFSRGVLNMKRLEDTAYQ